MTASYSLRTLAAPELRVNAGVKLLNLGLAAFAAGWATATGDKFTLAVTVVWILSGVGLLKSIDERAREIESEA
ncbi:hypothetical protein [Halosimplex sp. TS25]|uniref:hypothetical protein n=1 Tax=Halosimplex rarum TaxID=3396619 RepID=UPI0039EC31D6